MKELLLVIGLIFCLILAVVWIGSIGAMVSGDCDINAMGVVTIGLTLDDPWLRVGAR